MKNTLITCFAVGLFTSFSLAQVSLDQSFGTNGYVIISSPADDYFGGSYIDPVSGLLTVGSTITNGSGVLEIRINQFLADGSPNPNFGTNGEVRFPHSLRRQVCADIAVQPDGKILIAGDQQDQSFETDFLVMRLNPDGTPDSTFNGDGIRTADHNGQDLLRCIAAGFGKIFAGGYSNASSSPQAVSISFNLDGSLNTSYASTGIKDHMASEITEVDLCPAFYLSSGNSADVAIYYGQGNLKGWLDVISVSSGAALETYTSSDPQQSSITSTATDSEDLGEDRLYFWLEPSDKVVEISSDGSSFGVNELADPGMDHSNIDGSAIALQPGTGRLIAGGMQNNTDMFLAFYRSDNGNQDLSAAPAGFSATPIPSGHVSGFVGSVQAIADQLITSGSLTTQSAVPNTEVFVAKFNIPSDTLNLGQHIPAFNGLAVYPNPFTDHIAVDVSSHELSNPIAEVYGLLGNRVPISMRLNGDKQFQIKLPGNLPPGMYTLLLSDDKRTISTQVIKL